MQYLFRTNHPSKLFDLLISNVSQLNQEIEQGYFLDQEKNSETIWHKIAAYFLLPSSHSVFRIDVFRQISRYLIKHPVLFDELLGAKPKLKPQQQLVLIVFYAALLEIPKNPRSFDLRLYVDDMVQDIKYSKHKLQYQREAHNLLRILELDFCISAEYLENIISPSFWQPQLCTTTKVLKTKKVSAPLPEVKKEKNISWNQYLAKKTTEGLDFTSDFLSSSLMFKNTSTQLNDQTEIYNHKLQEIFAPSNMTTIMKVESHQMAKMINWERELLPPLQMWLQQNHFTMGERRYPLWSKSSHSIDLLLHNGQFYFSWSGEPQLIASMKMGEEVLRVLPPIEDWMKPNHTYWEFPTTLGNTLSFTWNNEPQTIVL